MKQQIDVFDYAGNICKAMKKGILLTTKSGGRVNIMTIGWVKLGVEWNKPIFIAYVRESRFTRQLLEESGEFTVNVPTDSIDAKILSYCGTRSGRDTDKIRDLNLTLEEPLTVSAPGIRELPLTLECKIIYKQPQDLDAIPADLLSRFYPEANGFRDRHIAFYGEIQAAYLITD